MCSSDGGLRHTRPWELGPRQHPLSRLQGRTATGLSGRAGSVGLRASIRPVTALVFSRAQALGYWLPPAFRDRGYLGPSIAPFPREGRHLTKPHEVPP